MKTTSAHRANKITFAYRANSSALLLFCAVAILATLLLLPALGACSPTSTAAQSASDNTGDVNQDTTGEDAAQTSKTDSEPDAANLVTLGNKSDTSMELIVTNATGKTISSMEIKDVLEASFSESVLGAGKVIEDDAQVLLHIEPREVPQDTAAQAEPDFNQMYTVRLTFDDSSTAELHSVNLGDLGAVTIQTSSEGVTYIEYLGKDGQTEDSLQAELALSEEARLAAKNEATAAAEAAAAAAANEAAAANQNGYDYGSGSGSGGSAGGSTYTQEEDDCVDDLVFR